MEQEQPKTWPLREARREMRLFQRRIGSWRGTGTTLRKAQQSQEGMKEMLANGSKLQS